MNFQTPCAFNSKDATTWITVDSANWFSMHQELYAMGLCRLEWLTGVHQQDTNFHVITCLTNVSLAETVIVKTEVEQINGASSRLASLTGIYQTADFHERETWQLLGIEFGLGPNIPAFNVDFEGHPLRRDFALITRQNARWPGAVEPDVQARRRPQLPPGVLPEWVQPQVQS